MAEQENAFASSAVPELRNKAPKAPGILPKNAQTWVIVMIAVVMILVIAFSNSGAPRAKAKPVNAAQQQTASPPNPRQIGQYKAMVDEEARKLAFERQRLDQAKLEAQNAAASAQLPPGQASPYPNPYQPQVQPAAYSAREVSPEEAQRVALEAERKKREYNSLFSSNISLSLRKDQNSGQGSGADQQPAAPALQSISAQLSALRQSAQNSPASSTAPQPATGSRVNQNAGVLPAASEQEEAEPSLKEKRRQQAEDPALQQADGKKYRLFEGTVLETVLTNRLNGGFSGPVNVMVTTNVYSRDHQQLLIPQGSRALGEVQKVNSFGQQRLAVIFHRLIMPDGYSLSLDQFQGLNQIGETGLRDQVNHHYMQVFGVSLAIGAIAGVEQAGGSYGYNTGGVDIYRQGVATSLSQSALRILDRYLNILPTFVIREGHRVKVYLTDDLELPAYDRHRLPGNL